MESLWLVMPVYNEERALPQVLREWSRSLERIVPAYVFCLLNDGSTDRTAELAERLSAEIPHLRVITKPNTGHGQTCIDGYRLALEGGASWVLQVDSDGQCDPRFLDGFWRVRSTHPVIYGYRYRREDGRARFWISRIVSLIAFLATGTWVKDCNVPYRLMRADTLRTLVPRIPAGFHLSNVLVAVLQQRSHGIHWIPIVFRDRIGGTPSARLFEFGRRGWQLFVQLRSW